ncbi:unnamed protein product [Chironomus riparius]|uniref:Kinesin motor domain-containing protein n=1 Tax=Chironomus riparius TaxID=315576 RepID=A0A9N9RXZ9_9DIPT|nr:unnamed protein product [Chironomus riparius]
MTHNSNISSSGNTPSSVSNGSSDERLVVAVRVRPLFDMNDIPCLQVTPNAAILFDEGSGGRNKFRRYVFDHVLDDAKSQEVVYQKTTAALVKDVLNGTSAAVFAYGATGSGITHTMLGPNPKKAATPSTATSSSSSSSTSGSDVSHGDGLMVKAIDDIFKFVENSENPQEFRVSISYLEIYNELIRDLLHPSAGPLELREDNKGNQIVSGLSEINAISRYEVISLLLRGNKARTVEPTAANQTSSRSHALLNITVTHSTALGTKQGRLYLTDLAGSERAKKTKNRGKRLQEGAHINKSLLALGNCINALAAGARYVNYRDSKLTRLLKEALSGKCKTVMIAHVSKESRHRDETKNTLVYAERANHITTRLQNPQLLEENREFPTQHYQNLVSELREEVGRLKSKMLTDRPRSAVQKLINEDPDTQKRKQELKYLREQIVLTFKQQMKLRRRLLEAESHLLGLELDAERQHMVISHWQGRKGKLYERDANMTHSKKQYNENDDGNEDESSEDSESASALRNAWNELAAIERETKRYRDIRITTERELEDCRKRGVALEDELPDRISSDEERELLSLLCRVHELEADKVSLQAERMARQAELRRRDLQLLRAERQRRLCEDIISTQRRLIEDGRVEISEELRDLYTIYQQEIHASVYTSLPRTQSRMVYDTKLPPIYNRTLTSADSSSSSDWSPTPNTQDVEGNVQQPQHNSFDILMGPEVKSVRTRLPSIHSKRHLYPSASTSSED